MFHFACPSTARRGEGRRAEHLCSNQVLGAFGVVEILGKTLLPTQARLAFVARPTRSPQSCHGRSYAEVQVAVTMALQKNATVGHIPGWAWADH
jgi:hypothetical protein